ncbi:DUF1284 domain-containing protein [Treponema sp. J25]|jgi:hypothetical protein|uniref:DUF1284 domain-containing protein n=1 Tax=Treponema sp. J25 TaxID=2094121 RepID=UPI00105081EE|nr:DUF1284 domain-containing protein [Treponema sp. J25]TCW60117.1 DUF1284 domain-containing protein [Treponema sp. J25]
MLVILRPHHLLCLPRFQGEGYSPAFVEHLKRLIDQLVQDGQCIIHFGMDQLCEGCPNNHQGRCVSEEKVQHFDRAVIRLLQLEERLYTCAEIGMLLQQHLTEEQFNGICSSCQWFQRGICGFVVPKKIYKRLF